MVPNKDINGVVIPNSFALVTEVHETIAPVTLFKNVNPPGGIVIQVIGPAILKSTSGAVTTDAGGNLVNVAPAVSYTPPPLIAIGPPGTPPTPIPPGGLNQNIVIPGLPLLRLEIGEPARDPDQAIAGADQTPTGPIIDTANNTDTAWGAVDVVRLTLLSQDPASDVAQVRVGHLESQALAPTGGIHCNQAVTTTTGGNGTTTTAAGNGSTTTTAGGNGTTTTTAGNSNGGTTTTTAGNSNGGTTTTTAGNSNGGTTTTTAGNGTTTTTATPGGGTTPSNNNAATTTTAPAQVQAVTFSQTPAATPQSQTPNFTG
jgi:hypothetical protein